MTCNLKPLLTRLLEEKERQLQNMLAMDNAKNRFGPLDAERIEQVESDVEELKQEIENAG